MGIFDFIKDKIQEAGEEADNAQQIAENWDAKKICMHLQNTTSIMKSTGYIRTLKEKCCDLSDEELIDIFEYAISRKNIKACNAMISEMDDRGFAYKNADGKFIKNY